MAVLLSSISERHEFTNEFNPSLIDKGFYIRVDDYTNLSSAAGYEITASFDGNNSDNSVFNQALNFDGTNQLEIDCDYDFSRQEGSYLVSYLVEFNDLSSTHICLLTSRNTDDKTFHHAVYDSHPRVILYSSAGETLVDDYASSITLQTGRKYVLGFHYDGNTLTHFINDLESNLWQISTAGTNIDWNGSENNKKLIFGQLDNNYFFQGLLEEIIVSTNASITLNQVQEYSANIATITLKNQNINYSTPITATTPPGLIYFKNAINLDYGDVFYFETDSQLTAQFLNSNFQSLFNLDANEIKNITEDYAISYVQITLNEADELSFFNTYLDVQQITNLTELETAAVYLCNQDYSINYIISDAYDIQQVIEINGENYLEFSINNSESIEKLELNTILLFNNYYYYISQIEKNLNLDENNQNARIYAPALFYKLSYYLPTADYEFYSATPTEVIRRLLQNANVSDFTLGTVEISSAYSFTIDTTNSVLSQLQSIANVYGGDLVFINNQINLYSQYGSSNQATIQTGKNLQELSIFQDQTEVFTKIYFRGKDDLTFSSINSGKDYLEDYSFTTEERVKIIENTLISNEYQLLDYAQRQLEKYANPSINYTITAINLKSYTDYNGETISAGDIVRIYSNQLNIDTSVRCIKITHYPLQPWNNVYEFSTTLAFLADENAQYQSSNNLSSSTAGGSSYSSDLVPFNLLKNSRFDQGLASWTNSGFSLDSTGGSSGAACISVNATAARTYTIQQTVYPSTRDAYSFSMRMQSSNLTKTSSGGIFVDAIIRYEDGTSVTKTLTLY